MSRHYVIQDPHHDYAVRFIEVIAKKYGHRPVCLYTDRKRRFYCEGRYPTLTSSVIAGAFNVDARDTSAFIERARQRYALSAVIPYSEETVAEAGEIAHQLGLDWNSREIIRRFRNKYALKAHIRGTRPDIRMNDSFLVDSADYLLRNPRLPERFVLKPNDGFGNRRIGFFDRKTPREELERFFADSAGARVLCEERIEGTEYFVNGQVDAKGHATIVAVFEYVRVRVNGRDNIDSTTKQVHTFEPIFSPLADYAAKVIAATGLRRSPFHMEIKVDGKGPCLIEVGARLAGNGNAFVCNDMHGGKLDVFDVAAHYYFFSEPYGDEGHDWACYDRTNVLYVHGIASRDEVIYQLAGIPEVEALPEFKRWAKRPGLGDQLHPTRDVFSMAYSLVLMSDRPMSYLVELAGYIRDVIRWNRSVTLQQRVRVRSTMARRSAQTKLRWILNR